MSGGSLGDKEMSGRKKYVFRIVGKHTVATLPMERLAGYLAELARLLGSPEKVHFVQLVERSVGVVHEAEMDAELSINARVSSLSTEAPHPVSFAAFREINRLLKVDQSEAEFYEDGRRGIILEFPGAKMPQAVELRGIQQAGKLDGVVVRIGSKSVSSGSKKDSVPLLVRLGGQRFANCIASRALVKKLAPYFSEGEIRFYGTGRWNRDDTGNWTLDRFEIENFEPLEDTPLSKVVSELRALSATAWEPGVNLWEEALAERRGDVH